MTSKMGDCRNYSSFKGGKELDRHEGSDYAPLANPYDNTSMVLSIFPGIVESLRISPGYGLRVRVRCHDESGTEFLLYYCHLKAFSVMQNEEVGFGSDIGPMGSSGNSTVPHLHLSLQVPNAGQWGYILKDVVDPEQYFPNHPHHVGGFIRPWEV